jgi:hypothetical protein
MSPMLRRVWSPLPALTLALAGSAAAASPGPAAEPSPAPAGGPAELARLVAPAAGEALPAGETAWLAWQPGPGLARFPLAEEWEAFLSLDGGRSFPIRLTPHLDLERSRVAFRVPPYPSDDVRLLLRFGDERQEREQPVPGRFRIAPSPEARLVSRRRTLAPGEPARPGERGVVLWAEGARDGSGRRQVEAAEPSSTLGAAYRPLSLYFVAALAPEGARPPAARPEGSAFPLAIPAARGLGSPALGFAAARPLLSLLHRLNR